MDGRLGQLSVKWAADARKAILFAISPFAPYNRDVTAYWYQTISQLETAGTDRSD
jgi:hypothetical protein